MCLGLCNMYIMNEVCIMKLGCKILNGDNDLWCNIMRGKYKIDNNGTQLKAKVFFII